MLEELKFRVYEANMLLPKYQLITFTWGNVSEFDPETGLFAIKPSGVEYDKLQPEDMVLVNLAGEKRPMRFCTSVSRISAASFTPILPMRPAGHRPDLGSPATEPPMRIISMARSPAFAI